MPCHDRSTSATAATRTGKGVKQRELDVVREGQPPLQHLVPQLKRLCQLAAPPAGADDVAVGRLLRGGTRRGAGKGSSGSVISAGHCGTVNQRSCFGYRLVRAPAQHQLQLQLTSGCRPRRFISSKKCIASPSLRFFMHANRPAVKGGSGGRAGRQAGLAGWWLGGSRKSHQPTEGCIS